MTIQPADSPHDPNKDREERARWFIRFFYGREPKGPAEISYLNTLYGHLDHQKFVYYASQSTDFIKETSGISNIFVDANFRRRIELLQNDVGKSKHPNTFVVGQPRSGTTSLYQFFNDHPSIYVPSIKETNYYSHWSSDRVGSYGLSYNDYLMYFMDANEQPIVCDISPFYLSEPGVSLRIYRDNPDAKVIAFLRNPIDIIISKYNLDHNNSTEAAFDQWIREGLAGMTVSSQRWAHDSGVTALFNCCIGLQLSEFIRYFGKRFRIYMFETVVNDQEAVYRNICEYLNIPFVYTRPYWAWKAPSSVLPSRAMLQELATFLIPEIKKIEFVLGHDLSAWYKQWQ